jgi:Fe-S cluster assembly ATP-binding protein
VDIFDFQERLLERMRLLEMDPAFASRSVNEGFSGGEKKRNEILQMAMLEPDLAVLDETDSGLDIDALKVVSEGVNAVHREKGDMSVLLITHYQRILNYIQPGHVHVMVAGRIVESGGPELARELEERGYETWRDEPASV